VCAVCCVTDYRWVKQDLEANFLVTCVTVTGK
jgi:hypothetical protein